jgi:DNA polymerase-1
VAADWSQIELRLVAHASGDKTMLDIFNSGQDIHLATAETLVRGKVTKETRKRAKAVNFGFVYGMFPPKFRAYALEKFDLKLSLHDSELYREAFFNKYGGLEAWHRRVEAQLSRIGYIDSVFGRRRHLPEAMHDSGVMEWVRREAIRKGINSPIQSAGSDLDLFMAALIASRSLPWDFKIDHKQAFIVGAAHDSLIFECHKNYVRTLKDGIAHTVKNLPTQKYFGFTFKVPVIMDVTAYKSHWEGDILES